MYEKIDVLEYIEVNHKPTQTVWNTIYSYPILGKLAEEKWELGSKIWRKEGKK